MLLRAAPALSSPFRAAPALALLLLSAVAGCDLLLGPPPEVIGGGRPGGDEGEGEGGDEGEGEGEGSEGEGEGDPDLPPDIPAHPLGPNIQSIALSTNRLDDGTSATLTVVVTDADGVDDIVGPLLIEPVSGTTLGTLDTAAPGTFTARISWSTWASIDPINFLRGGDARFIRVQFSDNAGHQVTATERIDVFCVENLPACDNQCGRLECKGECVGVNAPPTADDLCGGCNVGCQSNAPAGAACFNPSPTCGGGADCILGFDQSTNQPDSSTCLQNGGITLRDDNVVSWSVGGRDLALDGVDSSAIGNVLCADFGGFNFAASTPPPAGLSTSDFVFDVEDSACLTGNLSTCEPVVGSTNAFGSFSALQIFCVEPTNPDQGTFGHACFGGSCTDGSSCQNNICSEFCSSSFDCDICNAATGACTCNTSTGLCEAGGNPGEGGFDEPCVGGTFGTCNDDANLFCDNGVCHEACSFSSDCDVCNDNNGDTCTCNGATGTCIVDGGSGNDFSCVTSATRQINATGSFSGSTSGGTNSLAQQSCGTGGGGGPEQAWRFTPPASGNYTFVTAGFDTVVYLRSDCSSAADLACDDDDDVNGGTGSRVSASLTAGVPVLVVVDGYSSSGSYTLTISRP